jgi:hypothetical protein
MPREEKVWGSAQDFEFGSIKPEVFLVVKQLLDRRQARETRIRVVRPGLVFKAVCGMG